MGRYGVLSNESSRLHNLINSKYFLVIKRDEQNNPSIKGNIPTSFDSVRFNLVFEDKSVVVLENRSVLPRAFMVYDWEIIRDDEKILDKLLDASFTFDKKIVVEGELPFKPQITESDLSSTANYLAYSEQESVVKVSTKRDGFLFVSDTWYPGWKAYVDNIETKIYRANYTFRAVAVSAGEREVRFVYQPDSFYNGIKISIISIVILIIFGLFVKKTKCLS